MPPCTGTSKETPTKALRAVASRTSVPGTTLSSAFSRSVLTSGSAFSLTESAAVVDRRKRLRTPALHEAISGTFLRSASVQMKIPRRFGFSVRIRCVHPSPPAAGDDAGASFGAVDVADVLAMSRRGGVGLRARGLNASREAGAMRRDPSVRDERAAHDIKPRCGPTWGSPARLISTVSLDVVAKFRDTVLAPRVTTPPGISSWRRRDPTASAARG